MKSLTEIIDQNNSLQKSRNENISTRSLRTYSQEEERRNLQAIRRYGADFIAEVSKRYFPSSGRDELYPTIESAIRTDAPTLQFADRVWGNGCSKLWLTVQLAEVCIYLGIRDKISKQQTYALADALRSEAVINAVTMSEMMVFFSNFEKGKYETFHGWERPNPQVITKSFQRFLEELLPERQRVRQQIDAEEERRRREEYDKRNPPLTREEWMEVKTIIAMYNSEYTMI